MNLKDLKPAEYNPRKITDEQLEKLKKSLVEFGDLSGIIYNRRTGNVIGGHQRLKCLPPDAKIEKKDLKEKSKTGTVAHGFVIIDNEKYTYREVDWDDPTEKMANLAANKHGGEWDDDKLSELLQELSEMPIFDADITGFDSAEIDEILSQITKEGQIDDDEAPKVPAEPITKTGDLYILGSHRLLCGDCTKKEDVEKFMDGKKADMVFTDPPYGVNYSSKNEFLNKADKGNHNQTPIKNDKLEEGTFELWGKAFENFKNILSDYHSIYICSPQTRDLMMMMMMMMMIERGGIYISNVIIWVKNNHVLGRLDYNLKHEPIIYGWLKTHKHKFYGLGENKFSVWNYDKPVKSDLHPTMKPIGVIENAIKNSSQSKNIILDPFLGSGSTLIACEKTGRICYGMEIDPHYCDVIVTRFCKYTGNNKITKNREMIEWPL